MKREVTKEEAEELISLNRHIELIASLSKISTGISFKTNNDVVEAIVSQQRKIEDIVTAVKNIPKVEKAEVRVVINQEKIVTLLTEIAVDIVKSNNELIDALNNRLLPDTFDLIKNFGVTQSVKVNYKEANKISNGR